MHEESLVRSLLHQVEDLAQQHYATEVEDIEVVKVQVIVKKEDDIEKLEKYIIIKNK